MDRDGQQAKTGPAESLSLSLSLAIPIPPPYPCSLPPAFSIYYPMAHALFTPFTLRSLTFRNRIGVSPMCQYSCTDGFATDWHLVHLGSRAVGGAGLVIVEASAVTPEGRISSADLGIWKDEHIPMLERIARFITEQGAAAGIQLAHAGRKGSMTPPFSGERLLTPEEGRWTTIAPSSIAFNENYSTPAELDHSGISRVVKAFRAAALRALKAGFQVVEIHAAHGYLLHEFLSPLSNQRTDEYGGSFENRIRLLLEVTDAVRATWPAELPLFVRISATDWSDGGWTLDDSVRLAGILKQHGVDLVDCSSGGNVPHARIPIGPSYQVPLSTRIRKEAEVPTAAVGMITDPAQAEAIVHNGDADIVLLAREFLRDPYWPLHAASELREKAPWPVQYLRAAKSPN